MNTQSSNKAADIVVRGDARSFKQEIVEGGARLVADEPVSAGSGDAGPDRTSIYWRVCGVCTSMTVGLYARRELFPSRKHHRFAPAFPYLRKRL